MTSEAAILGVPSFRLNDFVGKISVMDEKEIKYNLSKGYKSNEFDLFYSELSQWLEKSETEKNIIKIHQKKMLSEKVDLSELMKWLFENFPNSIERLKKEKNFKNNL